MDIRGDKCKVLSIKEVSYDLVVLIKVREDLSVSVCMLGLTLLAVEWRYGVKFPPSGEFGGALNGGNGMECQGVIVSMVL